MAKTIRTYTGDGATTIYPVDFSLGYINRTYVYIYLASDEYTNQLSYTWLNDSQIELTAPVANGVEFNLRRVVPRSTLVNDYTDGAILREANLDNSFKQTLMALEEVGDGFAAPSGATFFNVSIDMLGNQIKNIGDAIDDGDGVSYEFMRSYVLSAGVAEGLVERAEAAAVGAESSELDTSNLLAEFREDYAGNGATFPTPTPIDGALFYYDGTSFTQGLYITYASNDNQFTGTWELVSGVGPQGPTGPQGVQGPDGVTGEQGIVGPVGIQGQQGIQGALGDTGPAGITGETGATGPQGVQGVVGPVGDVGIQGPTGAEGPTGPQGIQGNLGPVGNTGDVGPQGATGPTGPQGIQGVQGEVGPLGPNGPQGSTGVQGIQGSTGATGPTGADGESFAIDVTGTLAERVTYDDELQDFVFYATDYSVTANEDPNEHLATGDGSTTAYMLPFIPDGPQSLVVLVGGVPQSTLGYTVDIVNGPPETYTINFVTAPFNGANIVIREFSIATGYGAIFIKASATTADWGAAIPFGRGPRGDQGPQGVQGAVGVQGPTGNQGTAGVAGIQGPVGAVGPQGATGSVGPIGSIGPTGNVGATGATGPQGPTGVQGSLGPEGPAGIQGPTGIVGPQGATGPIGPQGQQGNTGDRGPTGIQGAEGARGPTGNQGPQGNLGATGPQGAQGPVGDQGARGDAGAVGPTGPKGTTGDTGNAGANGTDGADGADGQPLYTWQKFADDSAGTNFSNFALDTSYWKFEAYNQISPTASNDPTHAAWTKFPFRAEASTELVSKGTIRMDSVETEVSNLTLTVGTWDIELLATVVDVFSPPTAYTMTIKIKEAGSTIESGSFNGFGAISSFKRVVVTTGTLVFQITASTTFTTALPPASGSMRAVKVRNI